MKEIEIKELVKEIVGDKLKKESIIIGIDGCGGAGKSTLAEKLRIQLEGLVEVSIIHMDDFYLPSFQREALTNNHEIGRD